MAHLRKLWQWITGLFVRGPQPNVAEELLDAQRIIQIIWPLVMIGFFLTCIICGINHLGHAGIWSLACLATGAATGFLFGIPKVLQHDAQQRTPGQMSYRQRVNTNLEEISDWLTKIIVGLGLIQLGQLPEWTESIATMFADSVGQKETAKGVFGAIIVFFAICGFLIGYLMTRLYLQGALGRADRAASVEPDAPKARSSSSSATEPSPTTAPPTEDIPPPVNPHLESDEVHESNKVAKESSDHGN